MRQQGFTLIELSIVLVIIGLIVGGVLVGRDLISSAAGRAQITQIEKYHQAVNTFRGKYGYLPGDIKDPDASRFGFSARGTAPGQGNGDGLIQGTCSYDPSACVISGESAAFWSDLSTAKLIEGRFQNVATYPYYQLPEVTGSAIGTYLPEAKMGQGNYIYVWTGATYYTLNPSYASTPYSPTGINYFGITAITSLLGGNGWPDVANAGLTVKQAYDIDKKIDDGLPITGAVTAVHVTNSTAIWAGTNSGPMYGGPPTQSAASATSCFDNNNVSGAIQQYSVKTSNGAGVNCGLSFQFQ